MEFLDIVDKNDKIIGRATRDDIYKKSLCHRIAHVLVFNNEEKMFLQMRSKKVSFCPNHWSTAVGGHVQSGETYTEAAMREYQEELGTQSELFLVGKDFYSAPNSPDKFLTTFKTFFEGQLNPNPEEVSRVENFSIKKIKEMIENGEKFHPELLFILNKYYL